MDFKTVGSSDGLFYHSVVISWFSKILCLQHICIYVYICISTLKLVFYKTMQTANFAAFCKILFFHDKEISITSISFISSKRFSYHTVLGENRVEDLRASVNVIERFNTLSDGYFLHFKVDNGVSF